MNTVAAAQDAPDTGAEFISHARSFLIEDYLPKIERCLDQLDDENVWWRGNDESNSIGNLLMHLSGNVRQWIVSGVGGAADSRERQLEFDARSGPGRAELLAMLKDSLQNASSVLSNLKSSALLEQRTIQGSEVTVLEAIFHVVEHFSMHTGQIILQTKLLTKKDLRFYDLSTGDPVATWKNRASTLTGDS